ncbi:MAG TPA: uroporphyrinogen decarboxylase family protein [Armatimonadota bacterium]|jgi:uroporphyrinogen decarboxylase
MSEYLLPLEKPQPDVEAFVRSMKGEIVPARVPFVEYIVDDVLMKPLLERMGRSWVDPPAEGTHGTADARPSRDPAYWDNFIAFWHHMGYPYVRLEVSLGFPYAHRAVADTATGVEADRSWPDQHHGKITSWDDFESYPWPQVENFDFWPFEYLASHLPEGMGLIANHAGGPLEWTSHILSYEGLSMMLYDDPALVQAICDRIGGLSLEVYKHLVELPNMVAVFPGDDMGFKTGTLIHPDHLRRLNLPWHQKYAALAHEHGLLYFLHSCGQLSAIMDDLIDVVGVDAKHSYEDAICPVTEMYERYHERMGLLGGIDIDVLTRASEPELRAYVRRVLDVCASRGRYALGSGNSVPSYIPLDNYLIMLDEGLRWGK